MLHGGLRCLRGDCAHDDAGFQQGTGFTSVHLAQFVCTQALADTGQIDGLTTCHARMTGSPRQQTAQAGLHAGRNVAVLRGQQLKGQCLQGVTRQQSLGLAKLHMHRGFASSQHIVVHARHVVMHQGIGVDQFHGTSSTQCGIQSPSSGLVCASLHAGHDQQGPQTFAAIKHGITHGVTQTSRGMRRHPMLQGLLNGVQMRLAPSLHVEGGHASSVQLFRLPASSTCICASTALS